MKIPHRANLLLRLAVSAALIAWILAKTPFSEVAAAFRSADPRWILAALALSPFGYLASVRRWRLLIREHLEHKADHHVRLWLILNVEVWYRMFVRGETLEDLSGLLRERLGSAA